MCNVLLNLCFLCSFLLQETLPVSLELFALLLDPLLPPAGLAEPHLGGDKVVPQRCLWDIGRG